jgi:hypothetical protein
MAGSQDLKAFIDAGIQAAQTLTLVSRSGELVAMVTTYSRESQELSESELRGLDILAPLAADSIERSRVRRLCWKIDSVLSRPPRPSKMSFLIWLSNPKGNSARGAGAIYPQSC